MAQLYPWLKALHIIFVIAWMAGLFYLPRLYAYHVDSIAKGSETDQLFQIMERRLLKIIMGPAMIGTWLAGLLVLGIPGAVDWNSWWPWIKAAAVVTMTCFHVWLSRKRKELETGRCRTTALQFRRLNELPTVLVIVIVVMVVVKPF
ncbi:MAG: protoporphyrinogen oxidase HemJ [Albidovulum sp.]|nr:protoporphyrinogen oxidase HemJ [Albidovulum sp.]